MPHTRKKHQHKKIPKNYTPIENSHCKVPEVIDAISYCIKTNWITKNEWKEIVEGVNKKIK